METEFILVQSEHTVLTGREAEQQELSTSGHILTITRVENNERMLLLRALSPLI